MHAILGIAKPVRDPVTNGQSDAKPHTSQTAINQKDVLSARQARVDHGDCTEDTVRTLPPHRRHRP